MEIEFDPDKDAANFEKHGISLRRAVDMTILAAIGDDRFSNEIRFRAYGLIEGDAYCLAYTVRNGNIRPISLRRAHKKEIGRYVP
jgi:uncharacterized DUF497 family protein